MAGAVVVIGVDGLVIPKDMLKLLHKEGVQVAVPHVMTKTKRTMMTIIKAEAVLHVMMTKMNTKDADRVVVDGLVILKDIQKHLATEAEEAIAGVVQ